jgi:hypothetical protein
MVTPSLRKAGKNIIASGIVFGMKRLVRYVWRRHRKV